MKRTSMLRGFERRRRAAPAAVLEHAQQLRLRATAAARRPRRGRPCRRRPSRAGRASSVAAPVNAPRSWPKSSLSSSDSESAAQLRRDERLLRARRLRGGSSSASTSLPTPVSPRRSTLMLPRATSARSGPRRLSDVAEPSSALGAPARALERPSGERASCGNEQTEKPSVASASSLTIATQSCSADRAAVSTRSSSYSSGA